MLNSNLIKSNIPGADIVQTSDTINVDCSMSKPAASIMQKKDNALPNNTDNISLIVDGINIDALLDIILRKDSEGNDVINLKEFSRLSYEQKQAIVKFLYAKNQYEFKDDKNPRSLSDLDLTSQIDLIEKTELPKTSKFNLDTVLKNIIGANRIPVALDDTNKTMREVKESYADYLLEHYTSSEDEAFMMSELPDEDRYLIYDIKCTSQLLAKELKEKYKDQFLADPELEFITITQDGREYDITRNDLFNETSPVFDSQTRRAYIKNLGHSSLDYDIKEKENRLEKGFYHPKTEQGRKALELNINQLKAYNSTNVDMTNVRKLEELLNAAQLEKWYSLEDAEPKEQLNFLAELTQSFREQYKDDPEGFARAVRDLSYQIDPTSPKSEIGFAYAQQVLSSEKTSEEQFDALLKYCYNEAKFSLDAIANGGPTSPKRLGGITDNIAKKGDYRAIKGTFQSADVVTALAKSTQKRASNLNDEAQVAFADLQNNNPYISPKSISIIGDTVRKSLGEKANNYATAHTPDIVPPEVGLTELSKYTDPAETKWAASNTDAAIKAKVPAKFGKDFQPKAFDLINEAITNNFNGKEAEARQNALIDIIQDCHPENQQAMYAKASSVNSDNKSSASYQTDPISSSFAETSKNQIVQNNVEFSSNESKSVYEQLISGEVSISKVSDSFNRLTPSEKQEVLKSLPKSELLKMPVSVCGLCPEFIPQFVAAHRGIEIITNVQDAASQTILCMKKSSDNKVKEQLNVFIIEHPKMFMDISVKSAKKSLGLQDNPPTKSLQLRG